MRASFYYPNLLPSIIGLVVGAGPCACLVKEVAFMAMNSDFGRSALLNEQYQREMELIAVALQEESQDEREDRLGLVGRSWALTTTCFRAQNDTSDVPSEASVTLVRQ